MKQQEQVSEAAKNIGFLLEEANNQEEETLLRILAELTISRLRAIKRENLKAIEAL